MPPSTGTPGAKGAAGLAISGGAPPSRAGTRGGTALKTGKSGDSPLDALAASLIKKMRVKFGDVAKDVKAQEIIAQEVREFMTRTVSVREDDLSLLEDRLRSRLSGETPVKNSLAAEKRAQVAGDEWAKIYAFHVAEGHLKEKEIQELIKEKQRQQRAVLESQLKELEDKKKIEAENEQKYFQTEQASLREWEHQEDMRKSQTIQVRAQLNTDRAEQLRDRTMRREMALEKRRKEDEALAARIAYETRTEFEKEEAERMRAKQALKDYLLQNEDNKKLREDQKQAQWQLDKRYMEQYAAMLDKQEQERLTRLEKLKAVQARQADIASTMQPYKQWIDPALIDRYYKEREDALDREEKRRQDALKVKNKEMVSSLEVQVKEREKVREQMKSLEQQRAKELLERVKKAEEEEKLRLQREVEKKLKFKNELETQMKDNAHRRRVAPMSETEKLINNELLKKVDKFQTTGEIIRA